MKLIQQTFKNFEQHQFNLSIFKFNSYHVDLNQFIKSQYFKFEMQPERLKKNFKKDFLRPLFEPDNIFIEDFKFLEKDSVFEYLNAFYYNEDWGGDFKFIDCLLKEFKSITKDSFELGCYVLNKDWFDETSIKVREKEFMVYGYYILLIWLNKKKKCVYTCDFFWD